MADLKGFVCPGCFDGDEKPVRLDVVRTYRAGVGMVVRIRRCPRCGGTFRTREQFESAARRPAALPATPA